MARSLWLVLCLSSVVIAESGGFLRSRALAGSSPSTSMDGSLKWKGSNQPDHTFMESSGHLSDVSMTVEDVADPLSASETLNSSVEHFSSPMTAAPPAREEPKHMATSTEADTPFEVHTMLLSAMRTANRPKDSAGEVHPDYHQQSTTDLTSLEVNEKCVPRAAQELWTEHFRSAVDMMFQKTLYGIQHGLLQVAHSTVELIEGTNCGLLAHDGLEKLREQAERLQVLVSAGSLNELDVNVKYEPLKALTVAGVDIHLELNALLIGWQYNKGPEEMGRALEALLRDFEVQDDPAQDAPGPASDKDVVAADSHETLHETRTPQFWADVLQRAMARLGGGESVQMSAACLSASTSRQYGDALEDAIARMLEKTRRGMRAGIQEMATATVAFVDGLEAPCSEVVGAKRLHTAASRLHVFASAKSLVNVAKHVEYEPMKVLKVGGIDVHKELNRFLVAWIQHQGAVQLAEGLVDFFQDFKEHEVEEAEPSPIASTAAAGEHAEESEMLSMLRDAIDPAPTPGDNVLAEACLTSEISEAFVQGVERAIDHMLQKRAQSMQLGLKELADVSDTLIRVMDDLKLGCTSSGTFLLQEGARKLRSLTQKTTFDYGALIQYEALKTLVVGSVDIHLEINAFISAWKLRSHKESGAPFGKLMRKLVAIKGHDEL